MALWYGPRNAGRAIRATLNVSNVAISPAGLVTNGGSVTVTFWGGSLGAHYGIVPGNTLLEGTVLEVLLDAAGDNTLDVLFEITGGALQNDNPDPHVGVFAPANIGLVRVSRSQTYGGLPSNWSSNFPLGGADVNVYGIPEAGCTTFVMFCLILAGLVGSRRCVSTL